MPTLKTTKAYQYMKHSNLNRGDIATFRRATITPGTPYKKFPDADRYTLPTDWSIDEPLFVPLLQNRRSKRQFNDHSITLETLGFLLWAAQGVTASAGKYLFRTAPSAGALYPVETYLAIENIEGLGRGLYHFDPELFELEQLRRESVAQDLAMAALNQQFIQQAAVTFVWTSVFRRNMSKYGDRGLRYMLMDAGHICQNLLLAAEAQHLCGCPVGAFFDDEVNGILDIDGQEETVVYMAAIGSADG
ncbi:SagB/ThcOx family dehydrogenase [Desulfopila sp. IMCC35008]|uniref:SagB/ThcOx family dehydrogenase n=1 Tax=Desulfopila sp. IMCC35008 TaxID=2653858 RepID=UPI0013D68D3F|nr:SagB/ThcOx family dehydrogenase [Desulfopila sp. IMCC35008]